MLFVFATLLVGAQAATKAEVRDRRCVICDYVVNSLQNKLSDDILAKKKVNVGWRLNTKGKRVARSVAYGLSETGFMEYLEKICDINTIRWSFEYKKNGQVKLQDDGLRDPKHKLFKSAIGHDEQKTHSYVAACDWFLDKYEEELDEHVRKWPRQIVKTEKVDINPKKAGKLVDVYMGQYGGTPTIVYFMCALQTNLCKTSRWPDDAREVLVNQAMEYKQYVENTKEMEQQKREHKAQQKQARKAPPPTPAPSQDAEEVELDVTEDEIKAAVKDDTTNTQAIEATGSEDAADSDSSKTAGEGDNKEQKTEL